MKYNNVYERLNLRFAGCLGKSAVKLEIMEMPGLVWLERGIAEHDQVEVIVRFCKHGGQSWESLYFEIAMTLSLVYFKILGQLFNAQNIK